MANPYPRRNRWSVVGVLLAGLVLVGIAVVALGFGQGWLRVDREANTTRVEFHEEQFEESTEKISEMSDRLAEDTGEALERAGESLRRAAEKSESQRR